MDSENVGDMYNSPSVRSSNTILDQAQQGLCYVEQADPRFKVFTSNQGMESQPNRNQKEDQHRNYNFKTPWTGPGPPVVANQTQIKEYVVEKQRLPMKTSRNASGSLSETAASSSASKASSRAVSRGLSRASTPDQRPVAGGQYSRHSPYERPPHLENNRTHLSSNHLAMNSQIQAAVTSFAETYDDTLTAQGSALPAAVPNFNFIFTNHAGDHSEGFGDEQNHMENDSIELIDAGLQGSSSSELDWDDLSGGNGLQKPPLALGMVTPFDFAANEYTAWINKKATATSFTDATTGAVPNLGHQGQQPAIERRDLDTAPDFGDLDDMALPDADPYGDMIPSGEDDIVLPYATGSRMDYQHEPTVTGGPGCDAEDDQLLNATMEGVNLPGRNALEAEFGQRTEEMTGLNNDNNQPHTSVPSKRHDISLLDQGSYDHLGQDLDNGTAQASASKSTADIQLPAHTNQLMTPQSLVLHANVPTPHQRSIQRSLNAVQEMVTKGVQRMLQRIRASLKNNKALDFSHAPGTSEIATNVSSRELESALSTPFSVASDMSQQYKDILLDGIIPGKPLFGPDSSLTYPADCDKDVNASGWYQKNAQGGENLAKFLDRQSLALLHSPKFYPGLAAALASQDSAAILQEALALYCSGKHAHSLGAINIDGILSDSGSSIPSDMLACAIHYVAWELFESSGLKASFGSDGSQGQVSERAIYHPDMKTKFLNEGVLFCSEGNLELAKQTLKLLFASDANYNLLTCETKVLATSSLLALTSAATDISLLRLISGGGILPIDDQDLNLASRTQRLHRIYLARASWLQALATKTNQCFALGTLLQRVQEQASEELSRATKEIKTELNSYSSPSEERFERTWFNLDQS